MHGCLDIKINIASKNLKNNDEKAYRNTHALYKNMYNRHQQKHENTKALHAE